MRTLYLRNVPDEVVDRLERLAARDGRSVSATAIRELDASTRRIDNEAVFGSLPDLKIPMTEIVAGIRADRDSH